MEIGGINSTMPFTYQGSEKPATTGKSQAKNDTVEFHGTQILPDEEVEGVFNDTVDMIGADNASAMSVHAGLSESRVFALLGL